MYLILEDETGVISKAEASEFCLRKLIQMLRKHKEYIKGSQIKISTSLLSPEIEGLFSTLG